MKLAVENPHRIPRFGALFGSSGGVGAKTWAGPVATVFPEFIARDQRSAPPGAVKEASARAGAARRRSRGHGLARLDGTGRRATVAQVVMDEGRGRQWPLAADGADPTQAQRAGPGVRPGRRRQPTGGKGTMEARQGRDRGTAGTGGSVRSTTARPARLTGPATPSCTGRSTMTT